MMNSVFRTKPPTRSVTQINVEPGHVKVSVQLVTVQGGEEAVSVEIEVVAERGDE
jgi:hypothetical protein